MFNRWEILIGKENVLKLNSKHVLIVGLGGVGGYSFEALVRSNIGQITIIDNDVIDESNLNRQIITNQGNIGKKKVDIAKERAMSINPSIIINCLDIFLSDENINEYLTNKYDFIVDACDTIKTKASLINYALKTNTKIITCLGTANKLHPELLQISTLNKTSYDPIAKILRKEFKGLKIPVVYSEEIPIKNDLILGSSSFVPGSAGLLCASYVVNELLK